MLERQQLLLRLRGTVEKVWGCVFAVIRVSFGVILLVSIVVIVVVALVLSTRANGQRRGGEGAGHHVIRFIRPRPYGRGDWSELWWWMWWTNQNPFFVGYRPPPAPVDVERQRLMAQMDQMDEEEGVASPVTGARRRSARSSREAAGWEAGRDGG